MNQMTSMGGDDDRFGLPPRLAGRAARLRGEAEYQVFLHGLQAAVTAACDAQDSQALADSARAALEEEFGLIDWAMRRAGSSAAKIELAARKAQLQSEIDDRRIIKRFGR